MLLKDNSSSSREIDPAEAKRALDILEDEHRTKVKLAEELVQHV